MQAGARRMQVKVYKKNHNDLKNGKFLEHLQIPSFYIKE